MKSHAIGALLGVSAASAVLAQPTGEWIGCPWEGASARVRSVVSWDPDGSGPLGSRIMIATEAGVFSKEADGVIRQIDLFGFQGVRVISMTTWDNDGDGPNNAALVVAVQDELFGRTDLFELSLLSTGGYAPPVPLGGFNSDVRSMTGYDTDGDGLDELVAVGIFDEVDGNPPTPVANSAVLDGGVWSQLGTPPNSTCEVAKVLPCSPDDSAFPCDGDSTLVIGGFFSEAGGQSCPGVACWDDIASDWIPCTGGSALTGTTVVRDVAGWDSPDGHQLIVGGLGILIDGLPAGNIAHFDGTSWQSFGNGTWGGISAVTTFDVDGDGTAEPIVGAMMNPGPNLFEYQIQYWNGVNLELLDNGILDTNGFVDARDFLVPDVGRRGSQQAQLFVVGSFDTVDSGTVAENLTIWVPDQIGGPCNDADFAKPFGTLDFFDVQVFLNLFAFEDLAADLTGEGDFNFFDVQAFLNAFAGGCP